MNPFWNIGLWCEFELSLSEEMEDKATIAEEDEVEKRERDDCIDVQFLQ
jgi:hypothetical protein